MVAGNTYSSGQHRRPSYSTRRYNRSHLPAPPTFLQYQEVQQTSSASTANLSGVLSCQQNPSASSVSLLHPLQQLHHHVVGSLLQLLHQQLLPAPRGAAELFCQPCGRLSAEPFCQLHWSDRKAADNQQAVSQQRVSPVWPRPTPAGETMQKLT